MQALTLIVASIAMIPFITAACVALVIAALPVLVAVASWEARTRRPAEEPGVLPLPQPTAA